MHYSWDHEETEKDSRSFDDVGGKFIKHTKIGVWDFYEDMQSLRKKFSFSSPVILQKLEEFLISIPYVWGSLKTLIRLSSPLLFLYSSCSFLGSLIPAVNLYYSSQLLQVVEKSIEARSVDRTLLFQILFYRIGCATLARFCHAVQDWTSIRISSKMRAHYSRHILHAHVRLDVPTFDDPSVRGQLESMTSSQTSTAWSGIKMLIAIISTIVQTMSQLAVLISALRSQSDGILLACLSFVSPIITWLRRGSGFRGGVWAATCRDINYIRLQGLKMLANDEKYRKELVAGNLQDYILSEFHSTQQSLGNDADLNFFEARNELQQRRDVFSVLSFLSNPLNELPTLIFTLRAVQSPQSIPVSLASLTLIRQAVDSFSGPLFSFMSQFLTISDAFTSVRRLHQLISIPNELKDGTKPYPESKSRLNVGISVEFVNVSFIYPGAASFAIRNVSFKIEAGQLCIVVGFNGSGKSTILKLLTRLYDPTDGTILIDGHDIRSLRLNDLRNRVSVLFQDYTHFPLSIKENIGMGSPRNARDMEEIYQAASLGGALDMIEALPEGFDTFLSRPVRDYSSGGMSNETKSLFGRSMDIKRVKKKVGKTRPMELSGGQMQKIALSRTFMKSINDDLEVGLLLFDEPSASLDPRAEYDLFERLRKLRGNKTMIFSSHRFGNLTRTADLILYMSNSCVVENGTHTELMRQGRGYAEMYNIQASQFVAETLSFTGYHPATGEKPNFLGRHE